MPQKRSWFKMRPSLAVLAMALMLPPATWGASTFKVLYKFTGGADGDSPERSDLRQTRESLWHNQRWGCDRERYGL